MVKIVDYAKRTNSEGKEFFTLKLQGGLEMVKSKETGNYYATAKAASITSTFTEDECKALIGQEIPGSVRKIECAPYEYTVKETGEVIILAHRWEYRKDGDTLDEIILMGQPQMVDAL